MTTKPPTQNGDEFVLRKGPWMPEEDEILVEYVKQYGPRDWSSIRSKGLLPRTGKSCRLRWVNKLTPDLKRSGCKFSPEEETLVVEMQAKLGNKWAKIASYLPGRTDNDVKNFWSTRQKRLLRALQRPKAADSSFSTTAHAHIDSVCTADVPQIDHLGKNHCFNEFAAFQVQSPTRSEAMMQSGFGNAFMQLGEEEEEGGLFIRGQPVGDLRRLRHPGGGYNCKPALAADDHHDVFMVKLQDLVPNESVAAFMDSSSSEATTSSHIINRRNNMDSKSNMVLPAASKSVRSVKNRRPRSRRDSYRTGFGSINIVAENTDNNLQLQQQLHHSAMAINNNTYSTILPQQEAPQQQQQQYNNATTACMIISAADHHHDFKPLPPHDLLYVNEPPTFGTNYLDFLMQYDSCSTAPTTASTSTGGRPDSPDLLCCPDQLPGFTLSQWDKLPLLYPDEPSLPVQPDCIINIKEEIIDSSSCTPDSVLASFPSDVFDSLEPLISPSSSEWWQR